MKKERFNVGDKCEIISNNSRHCFSTREKVVITKVCFYDYQCINDDGIIQFILHSDLKKYSDEKERKV